MSGDGKLLLPYFFLSFLPCLVLFLYFYNHLSNIASSRRLFISYVLREISVSSYLGDRWSVARTLQTSSMPTNFNDRQSNKPGTIVRSTKWLASTACLLNCCVLFWKPFCHFIGIPHGRVVNRWRNGLSAVSHIPSISLTQSLTIDPYLTRKLWHCVFRWRVLKTGFRRACQVCFIFIDPV